MATRARTPLSIALGLLGCVAEPSRCPPPPAELAGDWALRIDLAGAEPASLGLTPSSASALAAFDARVEDRPAAVDTAHGLGLLFEDRSGRAIELETCARNPEGPLSGSARRCLGERCETGDFEAARLELEEPEAAGLELLGEWRGPDWTAGRTSDLALGSGHAIVARGADGLRFVDVSDARAGRLGELAHLAAESGDDWNDVALFDQRWALVASARHGLLLFDASDPTRPALARDGLSVRPRDAHNVLVNGRRVYVAHAGLDGGALEIFDFADPLEPAYLGGFSAAGLRVHDVFVAGDRAYLSCLEAGLLVVDVSDPRAPRELGRIPIAAAHGAFLVPSAAGDVVLVGQEAYAGHLSAFDAAQAERGSLVALGSYALDSPASAHCFLCQEARCYVAHYQHGLRVVDFSEIAVPRELGHFDTHRAASRHFLEGASGVALADGLVYVVDTERGLLVLRED